MVVSINTPPALDWRGKFLLIGSFVVFFLNLKVLLMSLRRFYQNRNSLDLNLQSLNSDRNTYVTERGRRPGIIKSLKKYDFNRYSRYELNTSFCEINDMLRYHDCTPQ